MAQATNRLTNFSTGELGVHLCNQLALAGFEVFCLKGSGATFPGPGGQCRLSLFNTNDDLLDLLVQISAAHEIAAVFHVAALCDYKVEAATHPKSRFAGRPIRLTNAVIKANWFSSCLVVSTRHFTATLVAHVDNRIRSQTIDRKEGAVFRAVATRYRCLDVVLR